jgi:hypothetical protein
MAKRKAPAKKSGGPYLAAALFCESIIVDKQDGAFSAIRIIDQIDIALAPSAPDDFPSEANRIPVSTNALLSFKTGNSPGDHTVRIDMESPSGKVSKVLEKTVPLTQQPNGGANIRISPTIAVKEGGLFLLHVFLDGELVTSMPLQVSIQRTGPATVVPPADPPAKK